MGNAGEVFIRVACECRRHPRSILGPALIANRLIRLVYIYVFKILYLTFMCIITSRVKELTVIENSIAS